MLRIPSAGDRPAPLVVPIRNPGAVVQETKREPVADAGEASTRRKKRSRHGESHSWDSSSGRSRHSSRREKRQLTWILAGVGGLLVLIVAGVLAALYGGGESPAPTVPAVAAGSPVAGAQKEAAPTRSEPSLEGHAETMARAFLEARQVAQLLPLVRHPELAAKRMARLHPDGTVAAPGLADFNLDSDVIRHGDIATVRVRTLDFQEKVMAFALTPDGWKVDWESWVAWSDLPWKEFRAKKPSSPGTYRVRVKDVEYYNRSFSDESKWKSFLLETPEGIDTFYGYLPRDSTFAAKLRPNPDQPAAPFVLSLRFPENAEADNQVLIESILAEGWVLENPTSP